MMALLVWQVAAVGINITALEVRLEVLNLHQKLFTRFDKVAYLLSKSFQHNSFGAFVGCHNKLFLHRGQEFVFLSWKVSLTAYQLHAMWTLSERAMVRCILARISEFEMWGDWMHSFFFKDHINYPPYSASEWLTLMLSPEPETISPLIPKVN